ncbi:MAG: serine/threonine-protein kinase [Gemmatimonadales bacterium]
MSDTVRPDVIADRYRVEVEIGRGGMATVYLCTDLRDNSRVAVKVLRAELGSAVVEERFLREIAFASDLDHPRIPKVFDSGVVGDLPFYVMTYIEGESLRAHLDRVKQLTIDEAVRITKAIIEPMAYAHKRGIVHRDLKPANVILAADGVYVLDFGIARAILASADDSLTSTGVAVGTPAYMSPEQALSGQDIDARSDIYSLACVTYEMIAGIPPFVGATAQAVMARRFIAPPPPLRETREMVPEQIEKAVSKALCKAPADRWQHVEDFGAALSETSTSPSLYAARAHLSTRRRRVTTIVLVATAVLLTATGAYSWSVARRDYVAQGRTALESWDLRGAESAFRRAVARKPDDATAQLWLGQLLMIRGAPAEEWQPLALRSADRKADLEDFDRMRAEALASAASDDNSNRCDLLGRLASRRDPRHLADFTVSLAFADCIVDDPLVVPDAASRSGFSFRRSYHQATSLYEGLATRNAHNPSAFRILMPRLERVLPVNKNTLRMGVAKGDAAVSFIAWPELASDTVAYVPQRLSGPGTAISPRRGPLERIVSRNVDRLQKLAALWTRNAPDDPDAHEMLARMLEAGGRMEGAGTSALAQTALARRAASRLARSESGGQLRELRLAAMQVRLLLKLNRFPAAASLADSVLEKGQLTAVDDTTREAADEVLAGLAALTGRLYRVIDIERRYASGYPVQLSSGEVKVLPDEIAEDALALESYAALGGPADSILAVRDRVSERLASLVPAAEAEDMRISLFSRPLSLAAPSVGPGPGSALGSSSDMFVTGLRALHRGDSRAARLAVDSLSALHSDNAPGEITMDAVLQEAWLRAASGDTAGTVRFLDASLRGLSRAPPNLLARPMLAASLVRAMILRAKLAHHTRDAAAARKWGDAAVALWGRGDQPMLKSLEAVRETH